MATLVPLADARRIVIKIGTGVLTSGIGELDTDRVAAICAQVAALRERGIEVVLVSSGAIGLGMGRLGLSRRPKDLAMLQACAAVGQSALTQLWQDGLAPHGLTAAQILLTREDLRARHRHNAVFNTIERLLANRAVPVVNENDTVSATEIKFGDNDTLSALVASVVNADLLFILSNIPGLIDREGTGTVVPFVEHITPEIEAMAGGTTQTTSVGGMTSKLSAARIARRAGCGVVIGSGRDDSLFETILAGQPAGTYFAPSPLPVKSHKRWIAIQDHLFGDIHVDAGATEAILHRGKSLLGAGVVRVEGDFEAGEPVRIRGEDGHPVAHGLASMDAREIADHIAGRTPNGGDAPEHRPAPAVVVHRDNLVLLD